MNIAKISGGLALLLMILIPCQSRLLSAPSLAVRPTVVGVTGLDRAIYAQAGELSALAFDVRLTDSVAIGRADSCRPYRSSYQPVRLRVASGPGEVALLNDVADSTGTVHALFYAQVPQGPRLSVVQIITSNDTVSAQVTLFGASSPVKLKLSSNSPNIIIDFGQPRHFELQAHATDDRGTPIKGLPVGFRVLSGAIQVETASVTDSAGVARATLNHFGNSLIPVRVAATVMPGPSVPPQLKDSFRQDLRYAGLKQILDGPTPAKLVQGDTIRLAVMLARQVILSFVVHDTTLSDIKVGKSLKVEALLRDESGRAIPGVSVRLETDSDLGAVTPLVQSDLDGNVRGSFTFQLPTGSATVTATVVGLEVSDRMRIMVRGNDADANTNTNTKGREGR